MPSSPHAPAWLASVHHRIAPLRPREIRRLNPRSRCRIISANRPDGATQNNAVPVDLRSFLRPTHVGLTWPLRGSLTSDAARTPIRRPRPGRILSVHGHSCSAGDRSSDSLFRGRVRAFTPGWRRLRRSESAEFASNCRSCSRSSSPPAWWNRLSAQQHMRSGPLFFDKTPEANWPVLWHQDLTLAVAEKHELDGWSAWSMKAGVWHVQPPATLLATMATVRLHLDDCGADNGPLRLLPGSHRLGRLSRQRVAELRRTNSERECPCARRIRCPDGPLLLHASSPARTPGHRRVIHLEFAAAAALPAPLRWAA